MIRVDGVRVTDRTERPWDEPPPLANDQDAGCELFGALLGTAGASLGSSAKVAAQAIPLLCKASIRPKQEERMGMLPDLQVRLSAGDRGGYSTDIVRDVDRWSFAEQPFVVPLDAIPADGLRLQVYDDDGVEGSELIGMVRLYKAELLDAVGRPAVIKSDGLATFELVVSRYGDVRTERLSLQARDGTRDCRATVSAGEVVRVSAAGQYKISSYYDAIAPTGYPGGGLTGYNFSEEPLKSAPHGSAFVLVGDSKRFAQLTAPCGAFLSPVGGTLTVGINDADPSNNSGSVSFTVERRAPSAEEWERHAIEQVCPSGL